MKLKTVLYETEGPIACITLDRPGSLNALNAELGEDLGRALRFAGADAATRVVLLAGSGRAFCAGGDLKAMASGGGTGGDNPQLAAILRNFHDIVGCMMSLDKPLIAAIHGSAVGAGMSIALACDLRGASEDATVSQAFVRIGLSPDGGSTWLLPRLVGPGRAREMMMTGATLDARRAAEWGIVNEVVPAGQHLARARELAARIAAFSPGALGSLKRLLRVSARNTFAEQLEAEAAAQSANADSDEFRAALLAFVNRK